MSDTGRYKDWKGTVHYTYPGLTLAVLMDIRDELQQLNAVLNCRNFLAIPHTLKTIARNTRKKPKAKKTKPVT